MRSISGQPRLRLEILEGRVLLHGGTHIDPCDEFLVDPSQGEGDMAGHVHLDPTALPPQLVIHGTEVMPNPVASPTARTVDCGSWSDPGIWENGHVPGPTDTVLINDHVIIDTTDAQARAILITENAALVFHPHVNTQLKVGTLVVADNGVLQIGSAHEPVDAGVTARIVIADQPLNLALDPRQYLTGLLALDHATVRVYGAEKTSDATSLRLAVEPHAGDTKLTLEHAPAGWRVGDRVVLPPTDPVLGNGTYVGSRETEEFVITGVVGNIVSLDRPLRNDHRGAYDAQGQVTFLPHVANLSRNVVIRSEDPQGTRGHVLLTHRVAVDIRYAELKDLGRTTGAPLDNTTFDASGNVTHVGTNQIGRYALHLHHLYGPENETDRGYQYTLVGNAVSDGLKWGIAIHQSSYGLIQGNNVYNFQNAGIATESGNEAYNVFEENTVFRVGAGYDLSDGFWFAGPLNHVRNNVVASANESDYLGHGYHLDGLRVANRSFRFPLFRGADLDRDDQVQILPFGSISYLEFRGNEAYAMDKGLSLDHYPVSDTLIQDFKVWAVWDGTSNVYGGGGNVTFDGLVVRKSVGAGYFQPSWAGTVTLRHADIQDDKIDAGRDSIGIMYVGSISNKETLIVEDSYLNNFRNVYADFGFVTELQYLYAITRQDLILRNVKFDNPSGAPFNAITLGFGRNESLESLQALNRVYVYDFNRVKGDSFQLYWKEQAADASARSATDPTLTNQQSMALYGVAVGGAVTSSKLERPGIVNGYVTPLAPGPVITGVTATPDSWTQLSIRWTTDAPANTQLEYGFTPAYELTGAGHGGPRWNRLLTTDHSVTIVSVYPGATLYYRVRARDAAGNETISEGFTATTNPLDDTTPPVIYRSAIPFLTSTKATVRWDLGEGTVSNRLEYGLTSAYTNVVTRTDFVYFNPTFDLTDLTPGTTYHYRLVSTDGRGNTSVSTDRTFTTLAGPTVTALGPVNGNTLTGSDITLSYSLTGNTDELDHLRLFLDNGSPVGEYNLDGTYSFANVTAGQHTITGYAVRGDRYRIPGTDFAVSFTSIIPNTAPVAAPGSAATLKSLAVDVDLCALVSDAETPDTGLTFRVGGAVNGTVALLADGCTTRFTPAPGYTGPASFTYWVTDQPSGGTPALTIGPITVSVTVAATNTPPVAVTRSISTLKGTLVDLYLGDLVSDAETPDSGIILRVGAAVNGTVTLLADGLTARFTPTPGYTGPASFSYWVTDQSVSGTPALTTGPVVISVTVAAPNTAPVAVAGSASTTKGAAVDVDLWALASDAETPDAGLAFQVGGAANGTVQLLADGHTARFTPTAAYTGPASFTYWVTDQPSGTAALTAGPATVAVTVVPNGGGSSSGGGGGGGKGGKSTKQVALVGGQADGTATALLDSGSGLTPTQPMTFFPGVPVKVRTAVGDVNGDGTPDYVGGTGPGSATQVLVLDGTSGAVLVSQTPFEAAFTGGVFVAAADLNGDGRAEVVVTPDQGGGPRVKVYDGATGQVLADFYGIDDPNFRGGCRPALGDVNGDGVPDLIVSAGYGGGPRVAVFDGKSVLSGGPSRVTADFFAFPGSDSQTLRNGTYVAAGDVDGDGKADLAFGGGPGGGPRVYLLSGDLISRGRVAEAQAAPLANFFAFEAGRQNGVRLWVAEAGGLPALVAADGEDGSSRVRVYKSATLLGSGSPNPDYDLDPLGGGVFVG